MTKMIETIDLKFTLKTVGHNQNLPCSSEHNAKLQDNIHLEQAATHSRDAMRALLAYPAPVFAFECSDGLTLAVVMLLLLRAR